MSYQVNQVFAQTLSEVGLAVAQALGQMLQDPSVSNSFMLMAQDMSLVADRMDQGAALVGTYQGLAAASESRWNPPPNLWKRPGDRRCRLPP